MRSGSSRAGRAPSLGFPVLRGLGLAIIAVRHLLQRDAHVPGAAAARQPAAFSREGAQGGGIVERQGIARRSKMGRRGRLSGGRDVTTRRSGSYADPRHDLQNYLT